MAWNIFVVANCKVILAHAWEIMFTFIAAELTGITLGGLAGMLLGSIWGGALGTCIGGVLGGIAGAAITYGSLILADNWQRDDKYGFILYLTFWGVPGTTVGTLIGALLGWSGGLGFAFLYAVVGMLIGAVVNGCARVLNERRKVRKEDRLKKEIAEIRKKYDAERKKA